MKDPIDNKTLSLPIPAQVTMLEDHYYCSPVQVRMHFAQLGKKQYVARFFDGAWIFSDQLQQIIDHTIIKLDLIHDYLPSGILFAFYSYSGSDREKIRSMTGQAGHWIATNAIAELNADMSWDCYAPTKEQAEASFRRALVDYVRFYIEAVIVFDDEATNWLDISLDEFLDSWHVRKMREAN